MDAKALLLALALPLAAACTTETPDGNQHFCDEESRADTYAAGMAKSSDSGAFQLKLMAVTVEGAAGAPDRGNNQWKLELDQGATPMPGASIKLRSWMPDHGHGTTPNHIPATDQGAGAYEIGPFDLFMGGLWEFTFTIESGGTTDTAKFAFCVEG